MAKRHEQKINGRYFPTVVERFEPLGVVSAKRQESLF